MSPSPRIPGALVGVLLLAGCGAGTAKPDADAPLVSSVVTGAAKGRETRYTGTIHARIESDLGFRVDGKIASRLVDPGATVRRGQVLMRLDSSDLALTASGATDRLRAATADAARAAADEARLRGLVEAGAVSGSSYDAAIAAKRMTAANLSAARAAAKAAGNQRRYAALIADSDGVVIDVLAQPGQVVAAGTPVVRLAKAGAREALVAVPETARSELPTVATAQIYGADARYPARLREVAGGADPMSRTYAARYTLEGDGAAAPIGATVSLSITRGGADAIQVPLGALYDPGSGVGVWVIGQDRRVRWQRVRVDAWRDEAAQLAAGGLHPGERIVALGAQLLREGERVRLVAASQP
ncbi:efflux RND transporter periplasmic adaptor subunit [Sphingomonas sp. SUN019]|uniref:efflux RND transporter periplasmic adaptor subunit n=1 Tax=Sphingomonas sp. SUN019 TaxID=2937788 RepID=UPI00216414F8|nr:efflux RND transporter periplasmic adaptor subunit [Sphingomonas sp. SUN019]UVO49665.1 efflux RND transporter periplasmic adaptor subunit [Sphingomonas sp. SUN019]